jgi:DNA (cytosine-5)-methyltransferase 1
VENVAALLSGPSEQRGGWFGSILGDLADCGYDAEWENIPAAAVGAPHRRERVWIVAYPKRLATDQQFKTDVQRGWAEQAKQVGLGSGKANVAAAASQRQQGQGEPEQPFSATPPSDRQASILGAIRVAREWSIEPDVGRVANGVPQRVDRLKGLGNAVVPKIPELIGRAIMEAEEMT